MRELFDGAGTDEHRLDTGRLRPQDIDFVEVAHVQGFLRRYMERLKRRLEDPRIRFSMPTTPESTTTSK
jgi:hypothetical protein